MDLPLLDHAQQLGLEHRRHVADLVEQERAAVGLEKQAAMVLARVGEGAATVTEQLALEQVLGNRGTVDGEERRLAARAGGVQRAGQHLLAGPALAQQQHRRVGVGGAQRQLQRAPHRGRFGDDLDRAGARHGVRARQLAPHPAPDERVLDRGPELVEPERLGDVVEGAGPHRVDRRLDRPERGDDHHRHARIARPHLGQQIAALHARHHLIGHDDVDRRVVEMAQRLGAVGGGPHLVARLAQLLLEPGAHLDVVLDHQHRARRVHVDASRDSWRSRADASIGSSTVKRVPCPGRLVTSIRPPCSCTMRYDTEAQGRFRRRPPWW